MTKIWYIFYIFIFSIFNSMPDVIILVSVTWFSELWFISFARSSGQVMQRFSRERPINFSITSMQFCPTFFHNHDPCFSFIWVRKNGFIILNWEKIINQNLPPHSFPTYSSCIYSPLVFLFWKNQVIDKLGPSINYYNYNYNLFFYSHKEAIEDKK